MFKFSLNLLLDASISDMNDTIFYSFKIFYKFT